MKQRPRSLEKIKEEDSEEDLNNNLCFYNRVNTFFPNYHNKYDKDGLDINQPITFK